MSDESYDFSDITPVKINTEEPQLCQILYDDEYKQTMGILLSLMQKQEYSERSLYMTGLGIEQLASHYSIWIYRYNILKNLPDKDLNEELDWCEEIALDNEKNYQIWNYRQLIIKLILDRSQSFDPHKEFPIMEAMLDADAKNHHVWSYRKWLVENFDLYNDAKELAFVEKLIDGDLKNNSAWSHRFFLLFSRKHLTADKTIDDELVYVKGKIVQCPQNASTWNYLLGMYERFNGPITELEEFSSQFVDLENDKVTSSFALETLAKVYKAQGKFEKSEELYSSLKDKYDPIRANFWDYEISQISKVK
ncbi:RAM2 Protein farnesyltransferase/geranylgeranyltransferase type-1 subunit alpha [Candida maltosa Xu316]|uniref:Protein farnesyltransferase/geranylgeranyltransferase type-1 subunit alpha n=1 Tax=Candida maltosa (strain Xu316) TaxID=1245528 RepID=M3K4A5_CANMX|nr:Protein farnesyltransferase/geranylgeranyltransferase type I alpha subunit [Candida maltosa Xu316]